MLKNEIRVSRQQALSIIKPYFDFFVEAHQQAFEQYNQNTPYAHKVSNGSRSYTLHDLIIDNVKTKLFESEDIAFTKKAGLEVLIIRKVLVVRFKKLNDRLLTFNQPTRQVGRFNSQNVVFEELSQQYLPGIVTDEPLITPNYANVNIGYIPTPAYTGIEQLYITYPMNNRQNLWSHCFFNSAHVDSDTSKIIQLPQSEPPEPNDPLSIKEELRKDKADEEED